MQKKSLAIVLGVLLAVSVLGCGNNSAQKSEDTQEKAAQDSGKEQDAEEKEEEKEETLMGADTAVTRFKVGTTTAPDGHYVKGLQEMQRLLEEYSGGEMTLDIYPNSQLGNERDLMENVGMGVQEMCLISTGPIPNFVPDFAVLDLPYLFDDAEQAYEVLDGEIGTSLLKQLESQGIYGVGFWECGFRDVTNNKKEIVTPDDLKGMKIRTMENNVHMATYNALGATATPMAWSEIFTALQQGTVDGQETPIQIIASAKVYEVQKYTSMIGLFYSPCVLMISQDIYNGLTEEQKEAFDKAAEEAKVYQREYSQSFLDEGIQIMKDAGVVFTDVDKEVWKQAASVVYDQAESLGLDQELVDKLTKK